MPGGPIAQFVKPVGDALQGKVFLGGALLGLVGYVVYDTMKDLEASLRLPPASSAIRPAAHERALPGGGVGRVRVPLLPRHTEGQRPAWPRGSGG